MLLRPLNDTIIIRPDENIKYEGILEVPDNNSIEKRSHIATVISCGNKCHYKFKPGQRIIIDRWLEQGRDSYFVMNGERYRFIAEHYVHAVIE